MNTLNEKLSNFLTTYATQVATETVPLEKDEFLKNITRLIRKIFSAQLREERLLAQREARRAARIAARKARNQPPVVCSVDGQLYDSVAEACKAVNIEYWVGFGRFRSEYWPTWISDEVKKVVKIRDKKTGAMKCTIDGVIYKSISKAAKSLNISVGSVYYRLHSDAYPNWKVNEND